MPSRTIFMTAILSVILPTTLGFAQDAECDPVTDVSITHPDWVQRWDDSTRRRIGNQFVGATKMMKTPPSDLPWERLRFLDSISDEPIRFEALARDFSGVPYVKDVILEDPVLMITFDQNVSNQYNSTDIVDWESYRPLGRGLLQEYVVNPLDGETNQWFTSHLNGREYMATQLGLDPECFNPLTAGADGCTLAINQALASVGVYWAGGPLGVENPANSCERLGPYFPYASPPGHLWWRDRVLVFVADRSSFIRPSFNPITTRDEPGTRPATNDGVPRWDGSSYVFPTAADPRDGNGPTYDAYLETVQDFVGYIANGNGPNNTPEVFRSKLLPDGTFIDGFQAWHQGWRDFCWGNPIGSDPCPYYNWPFSGIGITVNWTQMPPKGPADFNSAFSAASEFISIGEKPIYLVAIREAHEYFGSPEPEASTTTWCDACPGDYTQDGIIDGADLATLLLNWGCTNLCLTIDRSDPFVDGNDLALMLANWNHFCEWPLDWRPADCGQTP